MDDGGPRRFEKSLTVEGADGSLDEIWAEDVGGDGDTGSVEADVEAGDLLRVAFRETSSVGNLEYHAQFRVIGPEDCGSGERLGGWRAGAAVDSDLTEAYEAFVAGFREATD